MRCPENGKKLKLKIHFFLFCTIFIFMNTFMLYWGLQYAKTIARLSHIFHEIDDQFITIIRSKQVRSVPCDLNLGGSSCPLLWCLCSGFFQPLTYNDIV